MAQLTPEQKRQAARKRNAAARANLNADAAREADEATADEVHRLPADHRERNPRKAEAGQYGGPPGRPRFVAYGTDTILVEYEGRDWAVNPMVLDSWDDFMDDDQRPMDDLSIKAEARRLIFALFEDDRARVAELVNYLRDVYGYVSTNLLLGFLDEARREAEKAGN